MRRRLVVPLRAEPNLGRHFDALVGVKLFLRRRFCAGRRLAVEDEIELGCVGREIDKL